MTLNEEKIVKCASRYKMFGHPEMLIISVDDLAKCREDAEPVRHGHWIERPLKKYPKEHIDVCSICGGKALAKYNYCPNCGAKNGRRGE